MIRRDYFSHDIPGYGSVFKKMDAKGYCYKVAGENIGWNTYPDDIATAAIHKMFMDSSGHRKNILGKAWDAIGVGAYKGSDGKKMWTVLFADRAGCGDAPAATPKPKPKPTPKPTAKPKPKPKPEVDPEAEAPGDPQAHAEADPGAHTDPDPHADADAGTRPPPPVTSAVRPTAAPARATRPTRARTTAATGTGLRVVADRPTGRAARVDRRAAWPALFFGA